MQDLLPPPPVFRDVILIYITMQVLQSLSPCLSSETCSLGLCSSSCALFPSLSFKRSLCSFSAVCLPICLQRPATQITALALFLSFPLSLSFERSLCRFSAVCLPVCLQRPVTQISALARLLSSPLSLSRNPSVCSPLSISPSVFRDHLLRSLLLLFLSSPLPLCRDSYVGFLFSVSPSVFRDLLFRSLLLLFSFLPLCHVEKSLCRFSAVCLPVCLQTLATRVSALALFQSSPFSVSKYPHIGFKLSVFPSVFRDLFFGSLLLLFSFLPLSPFERSYVGSSLFVPSCLVIAHKAKQVPILCLYLFQHYIEQMTVNDNHASLNEEQV